MAEFQTYFEKQTDRLADGLSGGCEKEKDQRWLLGFLA